MVRAIFLTLSALGLSAPLAHGAVVTLEFDRTISAGRMGGGGPGDLSVYLLQVAAGPGEVNQIAVGADEAAAVIVRDGGAPVTTGAGCELVDSHSARCALADPSDSRVAAAVALGDGDDALSLGAAFFDAGGVFESLVSGGSGDDRLTGSNGSDRFDGGPGADVIVGGAGLDEVTYADRAAAIAVSLDGRPGDGEPGEDDDIGADVESAVGGSGPDVLERTALNPGVLTGNEGDDVLLAPDAGYTRIFGGDGDDLLRAGADADRLFGGSGADRLEGGDGDDDLDGGPGPDVFAAGPGVDRVTYMDAPGGVAVDLDDVADDGAPGEGDNVTTDVEQVLGSRFDDVLTGSGGADELHGLGGRDELRGLGGDDRLVSGDLGGVIDGGPGADWLLAAIDPPDAFGSQTAVYGKDGEADTIRCYGPVELEVDPVDDVTECPAFDVIDLTKPVTRFGKRGVGRLAAIVRAYHRRVTGRFVISLGPTSRKVLASGRFSLRFQTEKRLRFKLSRRGLRYFRRAPQKDAVQTWARFRGRDELGRRVSSTKRFTLARARRG